MLNLRDMTNNEDFFSRLIPDHQRQMITSLRAIEGMTSRLEESEDKELINEGLSEISAAAKFSILKVESLLLLYKIKKGEAISTNPT